MAKKKVVKNPRVPRTRNNHTQTEAAFWSMIRSSFRRLSMYWKPSTEAKKLSRRAYKGTNKRQKWEYKCNHCDEWFMDKDVQVDHIVEAGTLKSGEDLPGFVERLFCEIQGFQVLCKPCHKTKTDEYKKKLKNETKNKKTIK